MSLLGLILLKVKFPWLPVTVIRRIACNLYLCRYYLKFVFITSCLPSHQKATRMKISNTTLSRIPKKIVAIGSSFIKPTTDAATVIPAYSKKQIRIAVSAFFFCQGLCFASWASRIPDIKSTLQLSDAALGSILLALPAGQLLGPAARVSL